MNRVYAIINKKTRRFHTTSFGLTLFSAEGFAVAWIRDKGMTAEWEAVVYA
jgi:hypothetical protein